MTDTGKDDKNIVDDAEKYSFWISEVSPNGKWFCAFEDTGNVAWMYLGMTNIDGSMKKIHDALWIYNMINPTIEECKEVFLLWSDDSQKVALIVDAECWGMYDLSSWRKMSAPRVENRIESIPRKCWDNGITEREGIPIGQII